MKRIFEFLYKNKLTFVSGTFIVLTVLALTYGNDWIEKTTKKKSKTYAESHYKFENSFDLSKVPSGYVIWRHGVPEYPMEFIHGDSATKYEFYDVGIFDNNNGVVYQVRVPFYAIAIFREEYVNMEKYRKKNYTPPIPKKRPEKHKKEENYGNYKIIKL